MYVNLSRENYMTKEQQQLLAEMKSMCENLRASGISFSVTMMVPVPRDDGGHGHFITTDINATDDHEVLDMRSSASECWWKDNHKEEC